MLCNSFSTRIVGFMQESPIFPRFTLPKVAVSETRSNSHVGNSRNSVRFRNGAKSLPSTFFIRGVPEEMAAGGGDPGRPVIFSTFQLVEYNPIYYAVIYLEAFYLP